MQVMKYRAGLESLPLPDRHAKGFRAPAAQEFHRKATFFLDLVEADNSTGFHAPGEELRILTQVVDFCRKGQLALRGAQPSLKASRAASTGPAGD